MRKQYSVAAVMVIGALAPLAVRPPHVNPAVDESRTVEVLLAPPPSVDAMLKRSCFDCHSNETRWPWYSRLEPTAELMSKDVERGRAVMNFSEWKNDRRGAGMLLAACAAMESRKMPRSPYRLLHPEAVPSPIEVKAFCEWSREQAKGILSAGRGQ